MPNVSVTINGRLFDIACGEGEEARVTPFGFSSGRAYGKSFILPRSGKRIHAFHGYRLASYR